MNYRKLRITWSVAWGLVALLLCALWVRSYWFWDRCYWPGSSTGVQLNSDAGHIVLVVGPHEPSSNITAFFAESRPTYDESETYYKNDILGFYFQSAPGGFRLDVPHWFLVVLVISISAAGWWQRLNGRFSLRTLLITTTLVAVVLGLVVYTLKG
jgi:hypothetical protein